MLWVFYSLVFLISALILYIAGERVVRELVTISRILKIKEFVVSFFIMAGAASLPNLFVGLMSATKGIPHLSLGDIFGNNLIVMTLAPAIAIFFSPQKQIKSRGEIIQTTAFISLCAGLLPIVLIFDGSLSRIDGTILLFFFVAYIIWIISKQDYFSKEYNGVENKPFLNLKQFFISISIVIISVFGIILSAYGTVSSANFFATSLGLSLVTIGLFITGLGNALPEIYFAIISARKNKTEMILGDLLGSVIFLSSGVLGLVSLIHPISVLNDTTAITSRIFVAISAVIFYIFAKTGKNISRKEALILIGIYLIFIMTSILK